MKYKINNRTICVTFYDYFRAKRVTRDIKIAIKMIRQYNLEDTLDVEFDYSCSPLFYVGMKYNLPKGTKDYDYYSNGNYKGYYSFGGYSLIFNKKKFYDKVIKPHTRKEYGKS